MTAMEFEKAKTTEMTTTINTAKMEMETMGV